MVRTGAFFAANLFPELADSSSTPDPAQIHVDTAQIPECFLAHFAPHHRAVGPDHRSLSPCGASDAESRPTRVVRDKALLNGFLGLGRRCQERTSAAARPLCLARDQAIVHRRAMWTVRPGIPGCSPNQYGFEQINGQMFVGPGGGCLRALPVEFGNAHGAGEPQARRDPFDPAQFLKSLHDAFEKALHAPEVVVNPTEPVQRQPDRQVLIRAGTQDFAHVRPNLVGVITVHADRQVDRPAMTVEGRGNGGEVVPEFRAPACQRHLEQRPHRDCQPLEFFQGQFRVCARVQMPPEKTVPTMRVAAFRDINQGVNGLDRPRCQEPEQCMAPMRGGCHTVGCFCGSGGATLHPADLKIFPHSALLTLVMALNIVSVRTWSRTHISGIAAARNSMLCR